MRFEKLNDDELYMLKRACIEAEKYIYQYDCAYTDEEQETLNNLLTEIIDEIKVRSNSK